MKKSFAVFMITILMTLIYQPSVTAENQAATTTVTGNQTSTVPAAENHVTASPLPGLDYITLIHSGVPYTVAQALSPDSGYPISVEKKDNVIQIIDKTSGISAGIICETLDKAAFDTLRDYYGDSTLSDDDLFSRYTRLIKSYITANESLYNANNINGGKITSETAMRIYFEGSEKLFGLDGCSVYLYNIARYEGLNYSELSCLDLIIPDRNGSTIVMIKFVIPSDKIGITASETIGAMLTGIKFGNLPQQYGAPSVLRDSSVTDAARLGIYPAASQKQPDHMLYENSEAGFSVSLPDTYVPFLQNNLGSVYSYTSFKINPNQILSITSEPLEDSGNLSSYNYFMVASLGSISLIDSGTCRYGSNLYSHFAYGSSDVIKNNAKQFFYDYYMENKDGSRMYKIQLQSSIAEPGENVRRQLEEILSTFSANSSAASNETQEDKTSIETAALKSINTADKIPSDSTVVQTTPSAISAVTKYMNMEEGYSFIYPGEWQLEDVSADIAYDRLRLVNPALSGSLEILVKESELKPSSTFIDIIKSVDGFSASSWPNLTAGYDPPFAGKTSKLLFSDFAIHNSIFTINRLIAFTDENGRNRLCYCTDILKEHKLYSMFVVAGEYMTKDGRFLDAKINDQINEIAASFRIEATKESEARRTSGESRNRKIVFVENYLKQAVNSNLAITAIGKTQPDSTIFVTVSSTTESGVEFTGESGFYKVKLDYPNRKIELVNRVLNREILQKELAVLLKKYIGKTIINTSINIQDMTITIKNPDTQSSLPITTVYRVNASLTDSGIRVDTVIAYTSVLNKN